MDSSGMIKLLLQQLLVFVVLLFLVYTFVLSAANRLISRFWSPYWRTLATVVLTGIAAGIVSFIVSRIGGTHNQWILGAVGVIVTALVGGGIMNGFIRHKDGGPLGYQRAALACLILGIVVVLIQAAIAPWEQGIAKQAQAYRESMTAPTASVGAAASAPATATSVAPATTVPPAARSAPAAATSAPANASSIR